MKFVLIVIYTLGSRYGGYGVEMHDFNSKETCQQAQNFIIDNGSSEYQTKYIKSVICLPK